MTEKNCFICDCKMQVTFKLRDFLFAQCPNCSFLVVLNDFESSLLENIYSEEYYAQDLIRYIQVTEQQHKVWDRRLKLIAQFQQPGMGNRILDIGCGTGVFLDIAMKKGWDVFGIEISPTALEFAAAKIGSERVSKDFFSIDESPNSFDVVCMWAVIEHVTNPYAYFEKVYRLLKPNGIFALATVNTNSWNRKMFNKRWRYFTPPEHLVYFNTQNIRLFLRQNNFKPLSVTTWFSERAFLQGLPFHKFENCSVPIRILRRLITFPLKNLANAFNGGDNMEIIAQKI